MKARSPQLMQMARCTTETRKTMQEKGNSRMLLEVDKLQIDVD